MITFKIKNLHKSFEGVKAVNGLTFEFEPGKITSIIGPNGSGKTTLINLLTGFTPFDSGAVVISNVRLSKISASNVPVFGITRTFQNVRLFEQMTVLDNILVVLTKRGVLGSLFERHSQLHLEKAGAILKQMNLWEKRKENAGNLSYGQRKLLEIARVLAMDAEIIFFDEPFAGLFKEMTKEVVNIFHALREQGKTIVLVEHNMDLIRELSDYVFVMDEGKLLAEGKPEQVLKQKLVLEAYLGE